MKTRLVRIGNSRGVRISRQLLQLYNIAERLGSIDDASAAQLRHVITEMYGVLSVSDDEG